MATPVGVLSTVPVEDLFRSTCAPDLARMMIDLVDDNQAAVDQARNKLLEAVTTKRDYAVTFLRMFSEDRITDLSDVFAAARRSIGR